MTPWSLTTSPYSRAALIATTVLGSAAVLAVAISGDARLAFGSALIVLVGAWALTFPRLAVLAVLAFAVVVSGLRRITTDWLGVTGDLDPLLAIVPAAAVALCYVAVRRGALRCRTRLANLVLLLTVIAAVGVANPLQGSPAVGVIGFAFFGAPLLWFWIGRALVDDALVGTILRSVGVLSVLVATYGLAHATGWFPSWDQLWIDTVEDNFASLRVDGSIRPFATFTGPGELARYLALGIIVWLAGTRFSSAPISHRVLITISLVTLSAALLLAAVRGAVVMLALALGALFAARRRVPHGRALVVGMIALGLLVGLANVAKSAGFTDGMIGRQVEGLATPFSSETSTVDKRFGLFTGAMSAAVSDPIGLGTGVTTPAARLGDNPALNSEADVGDVALSWGIPGLTVYVGIVVAALFTTYQLASHRRDWLTYGALGVLFAALTQWINGGLYALAPLVWLMIGWADRAWLVGRSTATSVRRQELSVS